MHAVGDLSAPPAQITWAKHYTVTLILVSGCDYIHLPCGYVVGSNSNFKLLYMTMNN